MTITTTKPITKDVITREEALKLCPDYVAFVEGDQSKFTALADKLGGAAVGQEAISVLEQGEGTIYIRGSISRVDTHHIPAVDGPVVRFKGAGYTWRVDGDKLAFLLPIDLKVCHAAVAELYRAPKPVDASDWPSLTARAHHAARKLSSQTP